MFLLLWMQYCRKCSPKYEPQYKGKDDMDLNYAPKKIICVDCGEEVYLENFMASKTCRCGQCQMQRDKIKKSERNKRYYEAHKNWDGSNFKRDSTKLIGNHWCFGIGM